MIELAGRRNLRFSFLCFSLPLRYEFVQNTFPNSTIHAIHKTCTMLSVMIIDQGAIGGSANFPNLSRSLDIQ